MSNNNGYAAAFAIANASGNILIGVATGGAGCWAKGAGTTGKVAGYGIKGMDIGGNLVGAAKNSYDIYENGPSISNVVGIAGNGLGLAGNIKQACFTEGTQIVVGAEYDDDGNFVSYVTVNIEDVKVGDLVYSYDTATGEVSQKAVSATFVRTSDHINYLTIVDENGREQTIETTDGHPFWVVTNDPDLSRAARDYVFENDVWLYHEDVTPTEHGFWVEAKDLRVGDVFLGANGELSTLTNAVRVEQSDGIAVFNFSVEGNHNYFVLAKEDDLGQTCILVHNAEGVVYRFLREGEDPSSGLYAKNRESLATAQAHVNGAKDTAWISTSKHLERARKKFDSGNGVVEIDLSKVPSESIVDLSNGIPGCTSPRINSYAKYYGEVLVHGVIPPQAITVIQ